MQLFLFLCRMVLTSVVVYFFLEKKDACQNKDDILKVYLYGALILTGLVGVLDSVIVLISARGTMINTKPRSSIPALLVTRLLFVLPELGWLVLGTVWAWEKRMYGNCPARDLTPVRISVVSAWIFYALFGLLAVCVCDWLGTSSSTSAQLSHGKNSWMHCHRICHALFVRKS